MNHKEMTAHIRNRIKACGIDARVNMFSACGSNNVQVKTREFDGTFSVDEIEKICTIAKVNGLTLTQGVEIDIEHCKMLTGKWFWSFEL